MSPEHPVRRSSPDTGPATARDGNRYGMIGMAVAVATTLLLHLPPFFGFALILVGVGVDPAGIGLILGVDRFLDMCRTTLNVIGDLVAAQTITTLSPDLPGAQEPSS